MSHFCVVALIPKELENDGNAILSKVKELMEPYNENIEVEEHEEKCSCIGLKAEVEACEETERVLGSIGSIRNLFHALPEEEKTDEKWNEMVRPIREMRKKLFEENTKKNDPTPNCDLCEGTGIFKSTYNENSKWDWYRVGGRFNGWLMGEEKQKEFESTDNGFNFGFSYECLENNCIPVEKIDTSDKYYTPFAILTPDGVWNEKGKGGWWGMVSNEKDENVWCDEVKNIYDNNKDCLMVCLDVHI